MAKKKGSKRKVGDVYYTNRKIRGEMRRVRVKKLRGGKESVTVVYPKDKTIKSTPKSKRLKGIAKAKHLHAQRPKSSRTIDEQSTAFIVLNPTHENIQKWKQMPDKIDLKGVDTKRK